MKIEQLKKGNALLSEINCLNEMKDNYLLLQKKGLRSDFQNLLIKGSAQPTIRICWDATSSPKMNEEFHLEMDRFIEIMLAKTEKHIKKLEQEFEQLTAE